MEKLLEVTWYFRLKFIPVSVRLLWDTFNWRQTTSTRNIYHPSCLHNDWALQLMKALAAPSLFLLLSAPFWAHQHFMPAEMHSFQEWTWLFSNSHLPSPPNVHLVYQLPAITDVILCPLLEIFRTSSSNGYKHTLTSNFINPWLSPEKLGCFTLNQTAQQLLHFTLKLSILIFIVPGNVNSTMLFPSVTSPL